MSAPRLKIGVLGVGRMGLLHLKKYLQIPEAEVVGVYEADAGRAAELRAEYGVRTFERAGDLLFEVDAVSIASPTSSHYSLARQALEAGTHVLVEKPITETVAEAEELIRLAQVRGLVLQVGFIERYRYQALARAFPPATVRFIEGHRLSAALNREPSVDVVADLMIHDLDLALSLVGEEPSYVSAIGIPVVTPHYDIANVRLEFPGGAIVNLNASRVSPRTFRKLRVFSGESYASLNFVTNEVDVYYRNQQQTIERRVVEPLTLDALQVQCQDFVRCVRERATPLVTGEDGRLALKYAQIIRAKLDERNNLAAELATFGRASSETREPEFQ